MQSLASGSRITLTILLSILLIFVTANDSILYEPSDNSKQNNTNAEPKTNDPVISGIPSTDTRSLPISPSDNWLTFQLDNLNSGNSSSKAPNTNNTIWRFNDQGAQKGEIYSTPIVVENTTYFSTTTGLLYAVDRRTGDKVWQFDLAKDTYATPTYSNGYIYISTGTESENTDNYLTRINSTSGQEDSMFRINITSGSMPGAPLVIYNQGSIKDRLYFGTLKNNTIFCYNISTTPPQLDWSFHVPNSSDYSSDGIWSSLVYCNDSSSGRILFTINSDSVGYDIAKGIYCLDAATGEVLWNFLLRSSLVRYQTYSSPTVYYTNSNQLLKGHVLFCAGIEYQSAPSQGKVYCLDLASGEPIWNFTCGSGNFGYGVTSSPAVGYGRILFGACDGRFYALAYDGTELWHYETGDIANGIYSSPALADGKVYFGSCDGFFYCLNITNGSLIWKYDSNSDGSTGIYGISSSPAIASNRVYTGSCNGILYCFGAVDSKPPTIKINSPGSSEMINGSIRIHGTANDDIAVQRVQIKIDNGAWDNVIGKETWEYTWNTTTVPDGLHTISARAFDETGFAMSEVSVIINNNGTKIFIQITSHTNGQVVSGVTMLKGIASHNFELDFQIYIKIDDVHPWQLATGAKAWYLLWDTAQYNDGEYLVQVRAYDGYSNSTPIQIKLRISNYIEPIQPGYGPMFRTDYNRTGATIHKAPMLGSVFWKFKTENSIESSAIYYNKRLYFGSNDWFVYCLNSDTGKLYWRYETTGNVRSTPAIADHMLFIGSQDYNLYCLNPTSGELNWKYKTKGAIDSSPLVVSDFVVFGSNDGKVYALYTNNGTTRWKFDAGGELWASPVFYDNCVCIGTTAGKLYSIWLTNGTERWNFTTNQIAILRGIYSTPLIADDRIIFGSEDNIVYCLNASTGKRIWMFKTTGKIYSSAALSTDKIYISSLEEDNNGVLYALPIKNPNNGSLLTPNDILWSFKTSDYDGGSSPTVSISSGLVLIGSNNGDTGGTGKVFCLDEQTGEMLWNYTTTGDVHGTPIVAHKNVYIGSLDNFMYCLGENYSEINETDLGEFKINISSPVDNVYAGGTIENITIIALDNLSTPVQKARFSFNVTFGSLSSTYGNSDEFGKFLVHYTAPEPKLVKENTTVILTVEVAKAYYKTGHNSIELMVKPAKLPQDNTNDTNNSSNNGNGQNDTNGVPTKPVENKSDDNTDLGLIIMITITITVVAALIIIAFFIWFKKKRK